MKMEPIEGSETSAIINQTPGNYPKGNLLYSVHGESLKSRILWANSALCFTIFKVLRATQLVIHISYCLKGMLTSALITVRVLQL